MRTGYKNTTDPGVHSVPVSAFSLSFCHSGLPQYGRLQGPEGLSKGAHRWKGPWVQTRFVGEVRATAMASQLACLGAMDFVIVS